MKLIKVFALLLVLILPLSALACDKDSDNGGNEAYIVCPQCSGKCDSDSSFCNQCGSSLKDVQPIYPDTNSSENNNSSDTEVDYSNVDCIECFDNGYDTCQGHSCYMCEGKGSKDCYGCNGSGTFGGMSCFGCSGEGTISCFTCKGTGTIYHKYTQLPDSSGSGSNSSQSFEKCDKCEAGRVNCTLCEGTGRYGTGEAPSYGGNGGNTYDKLCPQCNGAKKQECNACGGDGNKAN